MTREIEWARLTAREVGMIAEREGSLAVLPVGALEQHGPHLPVNTDTQTAIAAAHAAARLVGNELPVIVLPALWAGMSEHHLPFGGTISLNYTEFHGVIRGVVRSLRALGFDRLLIVNGHGGNNQALQLCARELAVEFALPIVCTHPWSLEPEKVASVLDFFEDGWRHKRIDAELAATTERYQRRAEAGRQGGVASGQARQQGSNAAPMLRREGSNAEARLNQPQPHPQSQKKESQSGAGAPPDGSDEDLFYSRLTALEPKGIAKSRAMQLVKLVGDFGEVNRILDSAEAAKKPCQYLGKVIANRQTELNGTGGRCRPSPTMSIPGEPIWVQQRRSTGVHVERDGQRWRCQGEILNDAGEVVGF